MSKPEELPLEVKSVDSTSSRPDAGADDIEADRKHVEEERLCAEDPGVEDADRRRFLE